MGKISVSGDTEKQVEVRIDPKKLEQKNITYEMVKQAILTHNFSVPVGQVNIKDKMFNVQVENTIESIRDLKNIKIVGTGPKSIPLSDIASISLNNKKELTYTRLKQKRQY
ncbi:efflux RND transporter permease subunit [Heyndrickxia sporothermodurans]